MGWRVETLNEAVDAELDALHPEMRAKFVHIAELLETFGPFLVREPPLGKKLFEMRMKAGEESPVRSTSRRVASGSLCFTRL